MTWVTGVCSGILLIHMCTCDMTHSDVTWLIHVWYDSFMCDMTHSCLTWLIHVWHDSSTCANVTWLIVTHEWVMSHMDESCHVWMSHVTSEWVVSHSAGRSTGICDMHIQYTHMTDSTENATPPKSTKSTTSNSSVHIQIKVKSRFEFIPRDTEEPKFLDLMDIWDVVFSMITVTHTNATLLIQMWYDVMSNLIYIYISIYIYTHILIYIYI